MNKGLAIILLTALASACSSSKSARREANPAPCPNAIVLSDASRLVEFDGEQTLDDVAYTAEVLRISSVCRYFSDKPIEAELKIDLAFGKGPKASENRKDFKYFVAVTRRDRDVIAKQEFTVPVSFSARREVVVKTEDIGRIFIPRANESTSGLNFEIVVGLSLTPAQAIYNRSGKSLKFPNLK